MTQTPPESQLFSLMAQTSATGTSLDGSAPGWEVEGDAMLVIPRTGDIISKETFTDPLRAYRIQVPRYA